MKRSATLKRVTKETDIKLTLELDQEGQFSAESPIPFFNHMLDIFCKHGKIILKGHIRGDVDVDLHHTVEDTGIVIGTLLKKALGEKKGIERFASTTLPMDETLVRAALDLSGRPYFHFAVKKCQGKIGQFDVDNCRHFFRSLTDHFQLNLHIELLYGEDIHHIIEAIFKSTALSLKKAMSITGKGVPSTKGQL